MASPNHGVPMVSPCCRKICISRSVCDSQLVSIPSEAGMLSLTQSTKSSMMDGQAAVSRSAQIQMSVHRLLPFRPLFIISEKLTIKVVIAEITVDLLGKI